MRARAQRTIPLALTSAALTFGACGEKSKKADGDVSDRDVAEGVERVANAICQGAQRCNPVALEREFENLPGCVEYYKEYYSYYADLDDEAHVDDPARCRGAVAAMLDCLTRTYTNISCEAFDSDDYTDGDEGEQMDPCLEQFDEIGLACELQEGDDDDGLEEG